MAQWTRLHLPGQEMQETWTGYLGQEDSPGERNGKALQYSCLGNPVDRGAWQATVHSVPKESDTTERLNNNNPLYV